MKLLRIPELYCTMWISTRALDIINNFEICRFSQITKLSGFPQLFQLKRASIESKFMNFENNAELFYCNCLPIIKITKSSDYSESMCASRWAQHMNTLLYM